MIFKDMTPAPSAAQVSVIRNTFYAGFTAAFMTVSGPTITGAPEDEGCAILDDLQAQIKAHIVGLAMRGKQN